jgi:HAMP domain-containing protein
VKRAQESGLPEDAQAANDLAQACDRFEKKLYDLELTRQISIQMAPQIRLIQNNDTLMTQKIQSTIVNTIPLWKNQIVLALGISHSKEALEAEREVTNMTNDLLKKNAETLHQATVETAREAERGIVDIETLTHTNEERIMKDSFYDELESCDGSDVKGLIKSMQDGVEDVGRGNERFLVNGEECNLFYIPVKYTRWLFVTIVPCRAIDILSYLNGITVVLIVILAVMLVVIICHYYIKNGTEPLQQLIAMADSMAKGKLDSLMPDLKHNDEIKQLADSIENMRFTLSNYVDEHKHADNPEETT